MATAPAGKVQAAIKTEATAWAKRAEVLVALEPDLPRPRALSQTATSACRVGFQTRR